MMFLQKEKENYKRKFTSSVAAPSISAAALVATSWPITIIVTLVATTAATTATETALPVVKAFLWGRAGLAALLVVLLQESFSLIALHLHEGHVLQEVANLRESKVGLEGNRVDHRKGKEGISSIRSWMGRKRDREKRGAGVVVKTRTVTPPGDKKTLSLPYRGIRKSLRNQMQIDGGL